MRWLKWGAGALVAATLTTSVVLARYVTTGGRSYWLRTKTPSRLDRVRLPWSRNTLLPGSYGVATKAGVIAVVGDVVDENRKRGYVERILLKGSTTVTEPGRQVRLTGNIFLTPADTGLACEEVTIDAGPAAPIAWLFSPRTPTTGDWMIHVHGLGAMPRTTLRSVVSAAELGVSSLVLGVGSRRLDEPGPPMNPTTRHEIATAISYAREHGARRITICAWSFGAALTLLTMEDPDLAQHVSGLVLVSPLTDLRATVHSAAREAFIPRFVASIALTLLSTPVVCRLGKIRTPIDFESLRWGLEKPAPALPTLIIHSDGDATVPLALTEEFVRENTHAKLVRFPTSLHAAEWNRDPERFSSELASWLENLPKTETPS